MNTFESVYLFCYRISEYMDLTPAEVVGHTCYHFIHVEDLESLRQSHEDCKWNDACAVDTIQPHPCYSIVFELGEESLLKCLPVLLW